MHAFDKMPRNRIMTISELFMKRFSVISLLSLLFVVTGCASSASFQIPSSEPKVEVVSTFDARSNKSRDVEVVVYEPRVSKSKRPALIFLSGCDGGHFEIHQALAREFYSQGAVIAEVKSIEAYGDQCRTSTLPGPVRAEHVFLARDLLVKRGWVSPDNVALVGLSHGGWTAISASKMDVQPYVLAKVDHKQEFAAAVALYPWCDLWGPRVRVKNPMLVLAGSADTWTPAVHCSQTMQDDPNIVLHIYDGPTHAWDAPRPPRTVPTMHGTAFLTYDRNATVDGIARAIAFLRQYLVLE